MKTLTFLMLLTGSAMAQDLGNEIPVPLDIPGDCTGINRPIEVPVEGGTVVHVPTGVTWCQDSRVFINPVLDDAVSVGG